ncbi:MBOAT family protein [Aerococcaceae bacterium DSM 111021]|nr:MBOAT family protein [Aerococcaceae bacterium DSM 111021]
MAFSSIEFLFYFLPLSIVLYHLFFFSRAMQNILLVLLGFVFYAWGEPYYVLLFIVTIVFNYVCGLLISALQKHQRLRKMAATLGVVVNVSILVWMKYIPFLSGSLNTATSGLTPVVHWALPIGISFYIFSGISYLVDVYKGEAPVEKNILNLALFFNFFPKMNQGPIMRYVDFKPQVTTRGVNVVKFSDGATRFITGLSKKVLIANQMGIVTDRIFALNQMDTMSLTLAWLGIIAYTLQIYYDFSGYSDMAIGVAQLFGFELPENFNYPYISQSISEFWRRWHMTLAEWFKHYVYFPLGGSRVRNQDILIRNMSVVWLVTGLWHGANWTFLIWGLWNFIFIAFERIIEFDELKLSRRMRHIYAMFVVMIGWVIFRSGSLMEAGSYLMSMFNFITQPIVNDYVWMFLREYGIFYLVGIIFTMPIAHRVNDWFVNGITIRQRFSSHGGISNHRLSESVQFKTLINILYPAVMFILLLVSVSYLVKGTYNSFIYFQF